MLDGRTTYKLNIFNAYNSLMLILSDQHHAQQGVNLQKT